MRNSEEHLQLFQRPIRFGSHTCLYTSSVRSGCKLHIMGSVGRLRGGY